MKNSSEALVIEYQCKQNTTFQELKQRALYEFKE